MKTMMVLFLVVFMVGCGGEENREEPECTQWRDCGYNWCCVQGSCQEVGTFSYEDAEWDSCMPEWHTTPICNEDTDCVSGRCDKQYPDEYGDCYEPWLNP